MNHVFSCTQAADSTAQSSMVWLHQCM